VTECNEVMFTFAKGATMNDLTNMNFDSLFHAAGRFVHKINKDSTLKVNGINYEDIAIVFLDNIFRYTKNPVEYTIYTITHEVVHHILYHLGGDCSAKQELAVQKLLDGGYY